MPPPLFQALGVKQFSPIPYEGQPMKLLPGILLVVFGTVFVAFSFLAVAYRLPASLDDRAVFLIAVFVAGGAFEFLGARDLLRAKRLTSNTSLT
jgi:hypothetical protein